MLQDLLRLQDWRGHRHLKFVSLSQIKGSSVPFEARELCYLPFLNTPDVPAVCSGLGSASDYKREHPIH